MNYLVASDRFFKDAPGGSGRVAWELAKVAHSRGHNVALLSEAPGDGFAPDEVVEGVRIVRYRAPELAAWNPRRLSVRIAAAARAAQRVLGAQRWDVVHSHSLATGLGAFEGSPASAERIATIHSPVVLEQRINWADGTMVGRLKRLLGEPAIRRAERRLYATSVRLSALSQFTIREITHFYGPEIGGRITCIPWWCDAKRSRTRAEAKALLGWPTEAPAIFTLRRLVRRMGIDTLIEAVAQLQGPRPHVYVGGAGPERPRLETLARERGLESCVHFLGRLSDSDAALAYEAADLFVLPTRALECFGIIALEAMARGCPVVASRAGAIPEVVGEILPECLFEPGDAAQLAALLQRFVTQELSLPHPDHLAQRIHQDYSMSNVSSAYMRLLGL